MSKDNKKIEEKATNLVAIVKESDGGPSLNKALEIGKNTMEKAQKAREYLEQNFGQLVSSLGSENKAATTLVELRHTMDDLNPHATTNSIWFKYIPSKTFKRYLLKRYTEEFKSNEDHINGILTGLQRGKESLVERDYALSAQYDDLINIQNQITEDKQLAKAVLKKLDEMNPTDPTESQKISMAKNKVARRERDLNVAEQAIQQFLTSINQTTTNNNLLIESIESALFVGPMVLRNALMVQAALQEQKQVADAVNSFQTGLGNMMAQNAEAIQSQTAQIADLYNNPVIAVDVLEENYSKLMNTLNEADEAMKNSTMIARKQSAKLESLTEKMKPLNEATRELADKSSEEVVSELTYANDVKQIGEK